MNPDLKIESLMVGRNEVTLIKAFDAQINHGALLILSGRNGCGKSTLLKTIAGLQPQISGNVSVMGENPGINRQRTSKLLSYANTERVSEDFITVQELVEFGAYPYLSEKRTSSNTSQYLDLLGIIHLRNKPLNQISDGEWQKANIARALNQRTPLILLDEPTAFLDYPSKKELYGTLKEMASKENKLLIVSTHDIEMSGLFGDLFWHISDQELIASNKPFNW